MKIANIVSAIIGMLYSLTAFLMTFTFKEFTNVPVGPEFFPRILAVALFVCCFILLVSTLLKKDDGQKAPTISPLNKDMQKCLLALLVIIVYAILWEIVGFIIATPLALFVMMLILGQRKYLFMAGISVAATAVIFLAFKFLLQIEMPMGFLEDLF
ncbi:tripartite tricarboxylate transporter TctB family protein [Treponema pectinovorum]|uniref:tripartite tricarboxylate transporter TctB family protein n=1 Tax=Treponema pectinovorum TaxID=164 RepID=UPI003D8B4F9C